ncbi:MAG: DICT sensory domain-containing protein [Nocardioidaceae bacterium]
MSEAQGSPLSIRDVAERTGVGQPTLRIWEARYGFPAPRRLPGGHRRYAERDVDLIRRVLAEREAGLSLRAAIDRARADSPAGEPGEASIFAGLRRRRPDLVPYLLPKRTLIALSHAIEDECCARAERGVLFASFQRERFYRDAAERWRELARTAEEAVVFADFGKARHPGGAPIEVPLDPAGPFGREWSLVCDAPRYSACLSAWERPGQDRTPDAERMFETIWSVEPEIVRAGARIACALVEASAPETAERLAPLLDEAPPPSDEQVRLAGALASRMVAYVGGAEASSLPAPHASGPA